MPNHITSKIAAAPNVIASCLNEEGHFDFRKVIPFDGEWPFDTVSMAAEALAEKIVGTPFNSHPVVAALQGYNRDGGTFEDVSRDDATFEQFIQMLRNHRACGFLHGMDFGIKAWGTKWNAYDQIISDDRTWAQFDTAWSTPLPVFVALSKRFPEERIQVVFADEDTGSNCGTFVLLNGEMIESDIAKPWREQTEDEQKKWTAFACQVKGYDAEEDQEAS